MEADPRLARALILDELFDLALYRRLREVGAGDLRRILDELIPVEVKHVAFWREFFDVQIERLDLGRRVKLALIVAACRLFGSTAIHLTLEATEIYGLRKYLSIWKVYQDTPLGQAMREVLTDEFKHEDAIVSERMERRINPERIRSVFLGFNDGLVEILGAVSGFFAAFGDAASVMVAGLTVAVAGALSMAAGAFAASNSEKEVIRMERGKALFLGTRGANEVREESALGLAVLVGVSYVVGAMVPVLPVLLGATTPLASIVAGGVLAVLVSLVLAFLSGMDIKKRIATNLVIIALAVSVTYAIGTLAKSVWGIAV